MKRIIRHKGIWILIAALSLSLIVTALSVSFGGWANPISDLAQRLARPLATLSRSVEQNLSHLYGQAFAFDKLRLENQSLKEELALWKEKSRDGEAALRENALLRNLLELKESRSDFQFASAKVLSHSSGNWAPFVTINKGKEDQISPSNCVVDSTGALYGIVTEVGSNWSTVSLILNPEFSMGGEAINGEQGILEGDPSLVSDGVLKLNYLSHETTLQAGDEILTFSPKEGVPGGLPVGRVRCILPDPSGLYSYALLSPTADLQGLRQVFVITDFSVSD